MFAFSQVLRLRVLLVAGLIAVMSLSSMSQRAKASKHPLGFLGGVGTQTYYYIPTNTIDVPGAGTGA